MDRIDVDDLELLQQLDEGGLLGELGRRHLARRRALEAEERAARAQLLDGSKKPRAASTRFFDAEPTAGEDQLAMVVLHDEDGMGSRFSNVPTVVGESGMGPNRKQWLWQGPGLEFVARDVWTSIRRSAEVRSRLVVLDPGRRHAGSFADLFGLLSASPLRLLHVAEVWKSCVRATDSLDLLTMFAEHVDTKRDIWRRRIVEEQMARVRAQVEAAE